jgi:hypothetical protein
MKIIIITIEAAKADKYPKNKYFLIGAENSKITSAEIIMNAAKIKIIK